MTNRSNRVPVTSSDNNFSRHRRMDRAEVRVLTGLRKRRRIACSRVEHRGRCELAVRTLDAVRGIVAIYPSDCFPRCDTQRLWSKSKVGDGYLIIDGGLRW